MGDVEFDWDGSLRMARELWAFAESMSSAMSAREEQATHASQDWLGPHQENFATRMGNERTAVDDAVPQLRAAAQSWAGQWKHAMDQQNQILRSREWESREGDWLNRHSFGLLGSGPERPPDPTPADYPPEPDFLPTRGFYTADNP